MPNHFERQNNESWREFVQRISRQEMLEEECLSEFDILVKNGVTEKAAAVESLYEWDIISVNGMNYINEQGK